MPKRCISIAGEDRGHVYEYHTYMFKDELSEDKIYVVHDVLFDGSESMSSSEQWNKNYIDIRKAKLKKIFTVD